MKNQSPRTIKEIEGWLADLLADLLDLSPDQVDTRTPFDRYGLDSSAAVGVADALGTWLGRELEPTLLYDHPTIHLLAGHLAGETA